VQATAPTTKHEALRLARAVRRLLRWLLLVGFLCGMAVWSLTFDAGGFVVVMSGAVLWFSLGVLGAAATLAEILLARGLRGELARVRRSWGLPLWGLAPILWGFCAFLHLDARLWFLLHRPALEAAAADWRAGSATPARLGGFDIERSLEPDTVWFLTTDFLDLQGFVHDPAGVLQLRDPCSSGYRVRRLLDLGGGWRVFYSG